MSDADDEIKIIHSRESAAELKEKLGISPPELGEPSSTAECETADIVVCVPVSWDSEFDDNLIGACAQCNVPIFYRPHAPKTPPKWCFPCASISMLKARGRA